jgi:predicted dehydrogenase
MNIDALDDIFKSNNYIVKIREIMMGSKLRWGILGTGRINRALIPPLQQFSRRNELTSVASRSLDHAREYAHERNIPRAFGSYEEMLADPDIDVIYNSLPNHLHAEWTIRACQAGKHVLCEKPITLSVQELDQIEEAAQKAGVFVTEAFMYRHHPQTLAVLDFIRAGKLGQVKVVKGQFSFTLERPSDFRKVPEYGGGSVWDVGCYPISYSRAVTGMIPSEVFAWQVLSQTGVDEVFTAQMRYANGMIAQFVSGFALPYNVGFEIQGTLGTLKIPHPWKPQPGDCAIFVHEKGDQEEPLSVEPKDIYLGEVEDLADAILEGKTPRISLQESRENIATIRALVESAQFAQPVKITSPSNR